MATSFADTSFPINPLPLTMILLLLVPTWANTLLQCHSNTIHHELRETLHVKTFAVHIPALTV